MVLLYSLMSLFLIYSCEDTHSRKKVTSVTSNKENISLADTIKIKTKEKKDSIISKNNDPFKLTNATMKEFFLQYGKENPETLVKINTKYGDIHIELYKETPMHRANFIYLTKQKYFDETFFYRVAKGFVIQGGNSDRNQMAQRRFEIGDYTLPQEPLKGLTHTRGAVALSKQWVDNPSNRSTPYEFFIVVAKNGAHHLNGEHTIFGKVVKGMNIADKISNVPVDSSEWPKENIFIKAQVIR